MSKKNISVAAGAAAPDLLEAIVFPLRHGLIAAMDTFRDSPSGVTLIEGTVDLAALADFIAQSVARSLSTPAPALTEEQV